MNIEKTPLIPDSSAKTAIQKAWIRQARKQGIHSLSVSSLCRQVPCSRSTFYLYFGSLKDLEQELYNQFFEELETSCLIEDFLQAIRFFLQKPDYPSLLIRIFHFLDSHEELLMLLLVEQPDPQFMDRWKSMIRTVTI